MNISRTVTDQLKRNPFPLYRVMRRVAPVVRDPLHDLWLLFDFDSVKRALTDHETFSSRAAPPGNKPLEWLIFQDPPQHRKLRAIIMRTFTPRSIAALEPRIGQLTNELLDAALPAGGLDLVADFAELLPIQVIAELLGIAGADRQRLAQWSTAILNLANAVAGGEPAARAIGEFTIAKEEMREYLNAVLAERRVTPRSDLLSGLLEAEVDGERLTEDEILGFFQLLLLAGSETTTNLISNTVLCLIEYPAQLKRLREQPELLPGALEEVLRFRSPVQMVFRTTTRRVTLHGRSIPEGKLVLSMVGSANRDPAQFPQANTFDIDRGGNAHVGFGHGIHYCLGAALARVEARVALSSFLERTASFELAGNAAWEPRSGLNVHGPKRLPIRVTPLDRRGAPGS